MTLVHGEESGNSCEKVGQGAGWLQSVWKQEWNRTWIPRGMQLDVNVDCGCEGLISLMSMSVSALSVHTPCESERRQVSCTGKIPQKESALASIEPLQR